VNSRHAKGGGGGRRSGGRSHEAPAPRGFQKPSLTCAAEIVSGNRGGPVGVMPRAGRKIRLVGKLRSGIGADSPREARRGGRREGKGGKPHRWAGGTGAALAGLFSRAGGGRIRPGIFAGGGTGTPMAQGQGQNLHPKTRPGPRVASCPVAKAAKEKSHFPHQTGAPRRPGDENGGGAFSGGPFEICRGGPSQQGFERPPANNQPPVDVLPPKRMAGGACGYALGGRRPNPTPGKYRRWSCSLALLMPPSLSLPSGRGCWTERGQ